MASGIEMLLKASGIDVAALTKQAYDMQMVAHDWLASMQAMATLLQRVTTQLDGMEATLTRVTAQLEEMEAKLDRIEQLLLQAQVGVANTRSYYDAVQAVIQPIPDDPWINPGGSLGPRVMPVDDPRVND